MPFILLLLAGFGWILSGFPAATLEDLSRFLVSFLPPAEPGALDPATTARNYLGLLTDYGLRLTLVAVPTFLWFATRAFASMRTALNQLYDVSLRPRRRRHFIRAAVVAKTRDVLMVLVTLGVFLATTVVSTALALLQRRGSSIPGVEFLLGAYGRLIGELITFGFTLLLFLLLYRYASPRRIRLRAALLASAFAAVAFEVARRLFAFYLTHTVLWGRLDASIGALVLFVLWLYYSATVFLLGGVVAETWELRHLLRRHRAVLR